MSPAEGLGELLCSSLAVPCPSQWQGVATGPGNHRKILPPALQKLWPPRQPFPLGPGLSSDGSGRLGSTTGSQVASSSGLVPCILISALGGRGRTWTAAAASRSDAELRPRRGLAGRGDSALTRLPSPAASSSTTATPGAACATAPTPASAAGKWASWHRATAVEGRVSGTGGVPPFPGFDAPAPSHAHASAPARKLLLLLGPRSAGWLCLPWECCREEGAGRPWPPHPSHPGTLLACWASVCMCVSACVGMCWRGVS